MADPTIPLQALEHFRKVADMFEEANVRDVDRAKVSHERFNIFTTLLQEHDEVRLHTRFLHCLLDPNGYHDCRSLFLRLFFETLAERPGKDHEDRERISPIPLPPSESWTVEKEAPVDSRQKDTEGN